MHIKLFPLPLSVIAVLAVAGPASADVQTLGSDLSASATVQQAHQADTAFWNTAIRGASAAVPSDGQVTSITIKGVAVQPAGAPKPLNEVHFQTLDPDSGSGNQVYLSSAAFDVPYTGDTNQVTTFKPDNLCVHKGGFVDINDEGGWDGTGTGPYNGGVPFQIFGQADGSVTAWFSKDNGTKNGAVLAPPNLLRGTELLLQYTLATGDDVSPECGGPPRDPNGNIINPIRVTANQDAYVKGDGSFLVLGYCVSLKSDCTDGVATVSVNGRQIATGTFSGTSNKQFQVPMKLTTADLAALAASPGSKWTADVSLVSSVGKATGTILMHTGAAGAMHIVKNQRAYVRGNRRVTPAAFCGVSTGCVGNAVLTVKGKVIAKAKFATSRSGKITIKMKVPARIYKQLKRRPLAASLTISGAVGSDTQRILLRH